jgi:hypothetical protein
MSLPPLRFTCQGFGFGAKSERSDVARVPCPSRAQGKLRHGSVSGEPRAPNQRSIAGYKMRRNRSITIRYGPIPTRRDQIQGRRPPKKSGWWLQRDSNPCFQSAARFQNRWMPAKNRRRSGARACRARGACREACGVEAQRPEWVPTLDTSWSRPASIALAASPISSPTPSTSPWSERTCQST